MRMWYKLLFRMLLVLFWAAVIFVFTCTLSLEELFVNQSPQFQWTSHPDLSEMKNSVPPGEISTAFIIRKAGHALAFFILTMIIYLVIPSTFLSGMNAFLYACSTEMLQLFFMRDGRIYDIVIDGSGIVMAMISIWFAKHVIHRTNDIKLFRDEKG